VIANDQPTIFGKTVIAAVSSVDDGNMRFGGGDEPQILANRQAFLEKAHIAMNNTTLIRVTFKDVTHFARYRTATSEQKGQGMTHAKPTEVPADAVVVTRPDHALFLLLADCVGAIIYDEKQKILMVSHIGRHSAEIEGAKKSIEYLRQQFHTDPRVVKVWLSPAVGKATYPLHELGNKGLHEAITEQLLSAGVLQENIEISNVDTAQSANYYSHSQFRMGKRSTDGRFAIVAMIR
jgi:copper oxidase (laccase) domain-containing protein